MRQNRVGCLPVLDDGRLVGIVTSYDFLDASARLFRKELSAKRTLVGNNGSSSVVLKALAASAGGHKSGRPEGRI